METNSSFYGTEKINKIFFKIAPPVMLAQLIQALYNIVDQIFIGQGIGMLGKSNGGRSERGRKQ